EADLLSYAYAFEQRAEGRRAPTYVAVIGNTRYRLQRVQRLARGPAGWIAALGAVLAALVLGRFVVRRRRASALSGARSAGTS
ncbi:MAG: hypothetical protein ABI193_21345, partial [Minicystis sp.]